MVAVAAEATVALVVMVIGGGGGGWRRELAEAASEATVAVRGYSSHASPRRPRRNQPAGVCSGVCAGDGGRGYPRLLIIMMAPHSPMAERARSTVTSLDMLLTFTMTKTRRGSQHRPPVSARFRRWLGKGTGRAAGKFDCSVQQHL